MCHQRSVCLVNQRDRITKAAVIYADRNAQRKRVIGDEESAEWINAVLYRFWQFYEPGRPGRQAGVHMGPGRARKGGREVGADTAGCVVGGVVWQCWWSRSARAWSRC